MIWETWCSDFNVIWDCVWVFPTAAFSYRNPEIASEVYGFINDEDNNTESLHN